MSAEYAPGTVAVATVRGVPNVRVMRWAGNRGCWVSAEEVRVAPNGHPVESNFVHHDPDVTDIRPLAVLDLGGFDRTMVKHLRIAADNNPALSTLAWIADQIGAQSKPPKPVEPQGLGAVVEDDEGVTWVRARTHGDLNWRRAFGGGWCCWADIELFRVLSEGVTL